MGKSNTEQLNIAKKYLGKGGSKFRKFCGLPAGAAWCDAFVTTIFHEAGNGPLFCDSKKQTYCPTTMKWCEKNLASVPPYLALPSDIIFFDWEPNSVPNHIGFVRERKDCDAIYTIEGNTSGSIVANKLRNTKYVCGIFRPHFKATYKIGTLEVDGLFGYSSIAMLQKALKVEVDGILGQGTVKALQRKCGVSQIDGLWGKATSKAVQKMVGATADGLFGPNSVKALQRWINKQNTPSLIDKEMDACKTQSVWMKNAAYDWESNPTVAKSKKRGTCVTYVACVLQRIGVLKSGEYIWQDGRGYGDGKVYGTNNKLTVTYMGNKSLSSLKSKLKRGDIVLCDDNKSGEKGSGGHIFILTGKWDGNNPYIWDNETARKGQKARTYKGSRKVLAVARLKGV